MRWTQETPKEYARAVELAERERAKVAYPKLEYMAVQYETINRSASNNISVETGSVATLDLSSRRAGNPLPGRKHHQRTDLLENHRANRSMNRSDFRARCNETAWAYLLDTKDLDRSSLKRYAKVTTLADVRRQIRKHINRLESYFSYDVDNGRWIVKPPIGLFDRALVLYGKMKSHRRAILR